MGGWEDSQSKLFVLISSKIHDSSSVINPIESRNLHKQSFHLRELVVVHIGFGMRVVSCYQVVSFYQVVSL